MSAPTQPTLATVYFDHAGSGRYLPQLRRLAASHRACATALPLVVITDERTARLKLDLQGLALVVAEADPMLVRRIGPCWMFDYKAALLCAFLVAHRGRVLYLDADAELLQDPARALAELTNVPLALARDSGNWTVTVEGTQVIERNAGVIWFGGDGHGQHNRVTDRYRTAYRHLREHGAVNLKLELIEQCAWSWANAAMGDHKLPDVCNWQGHFWGPNPATVIRHLHGGKLDEVERVRVQNDPRANCLIARLVVIGTVHKGEVTDGYMSSLQALLDDPPEDVVFVLCKVRTGVVKARNYICRTALMQGATDVLMWDSDIEVGPADIKRLLAADCDVIGGLYATKEYPGRWVVTELAERPALDPQTGVVEVYEIGTGLKRIRTRVLERIIESGFPDIEYRSDDRQSKGQTMWNFNPMQVVDGRLLSEDYGFDWLARRAGFQIHCHTRVVAGHWGWIRFPLSPLPLPGTAPKEDKV